MSASGSQLLTDFQRQIEDEKLRRLMIIRQLEAERSRISQQQWARDREAPACTQCQQDFTLTRRRVRAVVGAVEQNAPVILFLT